MAKKDRIVRIRYDYDRVRSVEIFYLLCSIGCLGVGMILFIAILISGHLLSALPVPAIPFVVSSIPISRYWKIRSTRVRDYADAKFIIKNGERIIGTIKSLKTIKINEEFTYDIEYSWPKTKRTYKITTPNVIADRMLITEKDLPLKVIIYAIQEKAHAYAIINPPLAKMKARWVWKHIFAVLFFLLIIVFGFLAAFGLKYHAVGVFFFIPVAGIMAITDLPWKNNE